MSINLTTFWTTWGVISGDTSASNQYDFWRGLVMTGGTRINSQYDFFKWNNTTRYQFFKNLNSTYPDVWDETTFYKNTNDARIYDYNTFYTYAAQSLPGGAPTFYSEDFNGTNPFNAGNICGLPTEGLTTSYLACQDYISHGCYPTFYWTGANPSEPEIGDTLYLTASESTPLDGEGTFWLADGNGQSYQIDNSGAVVDKYACEPLRQINLLGEFSSWSGGFVLTTTDNVNYIYSGASLPGGDVKFRQDDSWDVNWGASDWPSGIGYQGGPNIPSQAGNWLVTFNRLSGAYDFVPVLTAIINPSFTIINDNVILYATTSYPTGAVYTWQLTDFYETATDEPITSFTGDTLPEGYFTSSGSSNVTLTIVNGIQTATTSSFQICPFAVSGSITPSSAYTNTNVILSGSSNYDGGYVDYTWYLTNFFDASTDEPITYYNGQVLPEGYFTTSGSSNVDLYISSCGTPAQVGIDVYEEPVPMSASGGTETTITANTKTYRVHTFLSGGTFTVGSLGTTSGQIEYLIVGGGGGGGATYGGPGGGGAGGFLTGATNVIVSGYSITIGSGGAGGDINRPLVSGSTGNNSTFANLVAYGGGGGGAEGTGANGGSGGGGAGGGVGQNFAGGTSLSSQGKNGGTGYGAVYGDRAGAGGGGAGVNGTNGIINQAGAGGNGLQSAINGTLTYYAGGGAGGGNGIPGQASGGLGGGGSSISNSNGQPGQANTGGGGAGGDHQSGGDKYGGAGGSGIVIIRYEIF